jgi:CheY-like chemotaxis protein
MSTASIWHPPVRLPDVRVLVVEDDQDTREMVAEFLGLANAVVFQGKTGVEGFEVFERERPDVVVSDLWMPGGDGYDMIRRIRALPPDSGGLTPAIAISAAEAVRPAIMAGFHAFAAKPFDIEALVDIIADFARPDDQAQPVAPWTITSARPGIVVVTFTGHVLAADMRALVDALVPHLQSSVCDVVADIRRLAGFAPSMASVGQRAVWKHRKRIRSIRIVGGAPFAQWVAASACTTLGVPTTIHDSL